MEIFDLYSSSNWALWAKRTNIFRDTGAISVYMPLGPVWLYTGSLDLTFYLSAAHKNYIPLPDGKRGTGHRIFIGAISRYNESKVI